MKISIKKFLIALIIISAAITFNTQVLAANFDVHINFNGKTIKMTSETPDLTWTINNLMPSEKDESSIVVKNIGSKNVDLQLTAKIEKGEDLSKILDVKIINEEDSEVLYSGKYSELTNINVKLESGKSNTYKITTSLPGETGNEFQEKECVVKLYLIASGELDEPGQTITTDEVESPQTGEGIIIYGIAIALIIAFAVLSTTYILNKKDK